MLIICSFSLPMGGHRPDCAQRSHASLRSPSAVRPPALHVPRSDPDAVRRRADTCRAEERRGHFAVRGARGRRRPQRNRGVEALLVTGVTTEVCVHTTVREANDRGYRAIVIADCCGSYFPEFHEVGLRMIVAQGGIFGWVAQSAGVMRVLPAKTHR